MRAIDALREAAFREVVIDIPDGDPIRIRIRRISSEDAIRAGGDLLIQLPVDVTPGETLEESRARMLSSIRTRMTPESMAQAARAQAAQLAAAVVAVWEDGAWAPLRLVVGEPTGSDQIRVADLPPAVTAALQEAVTAHQGGEDSMRVLAAFRGPGRGE